jgi:hypothetical protein
LVGIHYRPPKIIGKYISDTDKRMIENILSLNGESTLPKPTSPAYLITQEERAA